VNRKKNFLTHDWESQHKCMVGEVTWLEQGSVFGIYFMGDILYCSLHEV